MSNSSTADPKRELLRHTLATLAYRGGKAVRNASEGFAAFHADEGVRAPGQILAHIGDLMDWGLSMANGKREWHDSKPLPWEKEVERFFAALKKFDDFLASTSRCRLRRKTFSGADCRCAHSRRPDCDSAPPGGRSGEGRELLQG